jgi:hypothetical protein
MVDALGNPLAFLLTPGQAHDLEGADAFLPQKKPARCSPIRLSTPING